MKTASQNARSYTRFTPHRPPQLRGACRTPERAAAACTFDSPGSNGSISAPEGGGPYPEGADGGVSRRRTIVWVISLGALLLAFLGSSASPFAAAEPSPSPSPPPAQSSGITSPMDLARSRIDSMLRTGHSDAAWFSAGFLAQVPASKVDEVIASLKSSLGEYQSVEFTPTRFIAHFEKGTDDVLIHLDSNNKIDGLLFRPPVLAAASLDDGLRALRPTSGTLSYVIVKEGRSEEAALNASEALAVGSAFKLAVLNALQDEIAKGRLHWADVVSLKHEWKSLPSGVLRAWPDGTPLTLATLAAEMISISDNTAADALVRIVGASALRPYMGQNRPFLTTREVFALKSTPGADLLAAYRKAITPVAREAVLKHVDSLPLPTVEQLLKRPELYVEWDYSVRELCGFMTRISDVPIMSINPGVADATAFRHVAFKGGSDIGVINLTTLVTTTRGTKICFSATLNDPTQEIDESAFEAAYRETLRFLEGE